MLGNLFNKLKDGLSKTKNNFTEKVSEVLNLAVKIDEDLFEELEEILITADIGVDTSLDVIERVRVKVKEKRITDPKEVYTCLKEVLMEILNEDNKEEENITPKTVLVIGVNGAGKTTSIGKMSHRLKEDGYKVLMAAADTFRAAAIDQLEVWSNRAGVDIIRHQEGSDPASVVFDAIQAAKARKTDVLICDTAGRLHNKKNLMNELEKINRIIDREYGEAKKETLLVLDGTTGQNALQQAKQFAEVCPIDGIVITKLDGTAKGGVIRVGEGIDDLQEFDAESFVEALF